MRKILGVEFIDGDYKEILSRLLEKQFMVVPSGPGLSTIDKDLRYYNALRYADFAIPDSGFMVILARFFLNIKINKLSGPKFLRSFVHEEFLKKPNTLFLIDPNQEESIINREYLNNLRIPLSKDYQYVAPHYGKGEIEDKKLINYLINLQDKPSFIMINLGGGSQEPLAAFIKKVLPYKVAIICTGAAIAFETGSQAKIPKWVDNFYLGWLARIIQNPKKFTGRFFKAFRLVYVFYLCKINKL